MALPDVYFVVEEATKSVSLKLAEISEPKFYHQFGKARQYTYMYVYM